jgi:hypothetical protein
MKKKHTSCIVVLCVVLSSYTSEMQNARGDNELHNLFYNFALKDPDQVKINFINLIKSGVDINHANKQNETPIGQLYYSTLNKDNKEVRSEAYSIIKYSVEQNLINVNAPCYGKKTLIDLACRANDVFFINLLCDLGIDIIQKNILYTFADKNNLDELKQMLSPKINRRVKCEHLSEEERLNRYYRKYDGLTPEEIIEMDYQESGSSSSRRESFSGDNSEHDEEITNPVYCVIM